MTLTPEQKAQLKRLHAYLDGLKFVQCVGGVIIAQESRPVHDGRRRK